MLSRHRLLACLSPLFGAIALALSACAASVTPQLIAAYPAVQVIATYAPPPHGSVVVYDAYLDLRVADVRAAAEQAEALAYDHGGYVDESLSWHAGDQLHTTVTLAVPVRNYDGLYGALLRLGTLERERVSGSQAADPGGSDWSHFSTITVNFAPAAPAWRWPSLPSFGWNPLKTFRAAFGVFAGIFTYLLDIVIWIAVVFGPFVLMGVGLRALVRRWRPRP